jgi:hypothetical protein
MNSGERPSASITIRPASTAASPNSGSCWLRLASAACGPDVSLPSIQSARSRMARSALTPAASIRSGMMRIMRVTMPKSPGAAIAAPGVDQNL